MRRGTVHAAGGGSAARLAPWGGFALALLLAPLLWRGALAHALLAQMGIAIIACLAYNILFGQGGMLSFGHAVYSGLGSFLALHTLNLVSSGALALPVSLLPLVGGVAGLGCAALLGFVSTRRAGTAFAMITLGLGELVWSLALMLPAFFGGEAGVAGNRVAGSRPLGLTFGPAIELYYLIALYCFVCTALMHAFTRTVLGRLLNAVRDNAERVAFIGYDPRQVRFLAFLLSGFFMGVAGGLAALAFERVTVEAVGTLRSGSYLLFTFVGGATVFFGPILGGVLMVLAGVLLSELTRAWLLHLGLLFMLMVVYAPGGVAGLLHEHARVAAHRRLGRLLPSYARLLAVALPTLLGAALLLEMIYQRHSAVSAGSRMRFLGLALDVTSAVPWLAGVVLVVVGACALAPAARACARAWGEVQREIAAGQGQAVQPTQDAQGAAP